MNLINIENLTKSFTDRKLFNKASFSLQEGEKVDHLVLGSLHPAAWGGEVGGRDAQTHNCRLCCLFLTQWRLSLENKKDAGGQTVVAVTVT